MDASAAKAWAHCLIDACPNRGSYLQELVLVQDAAATGAYAQLAEPQGNVAERLNGSWPCCCCRERVRTKGVSHGWSGSYHGILRRSRRGCSCNCWWRRRWSTCRCRLD